MTVTKLRRTGVGNTRKKNLGNENATHSTSGCLAGRWSCHAGEEGNEEEKLGKKKDDDREEGTWLK